MKLQVSIIVVAYNIEKYIDKCLESIMNQTVTNIEIIVVNDGSTDSTLEIIQEKASQDNRIKIIDKQNAGTNEARKSGLSVAKGEYLLFVDGDDWLEVEALDVLYNKAKSNDFDIVCYNAYWSWDDKRKEQSTFSDLLSEDHLENLFLSRILPSLCFKFIKKNYIDIYEIEFASNISYAEDLATVASLFMYKPKVGFEKSNLYNYYQRNDSITKKSNLKVLEIDIAMQFIKRKLLENNLYEQYEKEYEKLVFQNLFNDMFLAKYVNHTLLGNKLNQQYQKYQINTWRNAYIKKAVKQQPLPARIRIQLYTYKYNYGQVFDKIYKFIKGEK
ncbi:MAG: glycosyltransferase family 2 protein [Culicoidibacterales bacterium]